MVTRVRRAPGSARGCEEISGQRSGEILGIGETDNE